MRQTICLFIFFKRGLNNFFNSSFIVISYSCTPMGAPNASTPSIASLTLTPARCRDLDQDMQALRLSRQDNPFIQKVIESRESLADTLEESVSDDAILMSQVFIFKFFLLKIQNQFFFF